MNNILTILAGAVIATTPALAQIADTPRLRVPLDLPLTMSGNFGELRANHFHSGVDFKTNARTGYPVKSAADGYVSRVVVSPWGFGRAVYVTHPAIGLVTVYGHLEAFSPVIDKVVRPMHYARETFALDTVFGPGELPVAAGQVIGRSGNAGSSGGPHLHMDVRDLATGDALDPLVYYRRNVTDNIPPEVRTVALYPREGVVDGGSKAVYHAANAVSEPFKAWGRVVPGIKAYDRMTGTSNIYGVKYLTFTCDGDTVYHRVIDRVDFNTTRAVNTLVEYGDVVDSNSWVMTTQVPESRPLPANVSAVGDGVLEIFEPKEYACCFILADEHGNSRSVRFKIIGEPADIPLDDREGQLLLFDQPYTLQEEGVGVDIPANALYDDTFVDITRLPDVPDGALTHLYSIGDPHQPLAANIDITLPLCSDTIADKSKYTVVRMSGTRPSAVASHYEAGAMKARVNRFGHYTVMADTVPPTVTPVGTPARWQQTGKVAYKIKDTLSGIETYRGEIDGRWAMFELDGKTGTLAFEMDHDRFARNSDHRLRLTVTDACGNATTVTRRFKW